MKNNFLKLIIAILIPQAIGLLGSLVTAPHINSWYAKLDKPSFNPPNWIFAPVWTTLFLLMGVSLSLVWTQSNKGIASPRKNAGLAMTKEIKIAFYIFIIQLIFNVFWSILFFALHNPLLALIDIIILWILILLNLISFYKINKLAGWLLLPYLLWVSFAAVLNWQIATLNNSSNDVSVPLTSERGETIFLDAPQPNDAISSPLIIKGQARGNWFFEASFPAILVDWDGRIIAQSPAQAQSNWMTEDYVPFTATLKFEQPTYKNNGALILKKDNPAGLPEYDDAIEVPVIFK